MKNKIFGVLQRVGRSFMLPLAILPVAGLFLALGAPFTNESVLDSYGLINIMGPGTFLYTFFSILKISGDFIFKNLPLLFAIGVAIGMAKKEKEVAGISSVIAFIVMNATISALLDIKGDDLAINILDYGTDSVLGISTIQMGVFGGIIVGIGVAALHNRFYKIELPQMISFFGGTRFVPIISAVVYVFVGIIMYYIWPYFQYTIYNIGIFIKSTDFIGAFIYGAIERALVPFGLHHVFYMPFWQSALGGSMTVSNEYVEGAQNIFFAQITDQSVTHFDVLATRFMSGKFPFMMFGLPGAALAMYKCAKNNKKKVVGALLLSASVTSIVTGITEPLEFTFLFVSPLLYGIHCILAGISYMVMDLLNVGVGMTFSGGLIDFVLYGVLQGNSKTNWIYVLVVGVIYFALYYFIFKFVITKLNLKTPGREDENEETKLYSKDDVDKKKTSLASANEKPDTKDDTSKLIEEGLGGRDNIEVLDCCATRLRVTVKDSSKVNTKLLKKSGSSGVIVSGKGVQAVYGPKVTIIKSNLEEYISKKK